MSTAKTRDGETHGSPSASAQLAALSENNTKELDALDSERKDAEHVTGPDSAQHGGTAEPHSSKGAGQESEKQKAPAQEQRQQGPPGGYDSTPLSPAPPGYSVKITFHRATALPIGDLVSLSSDPYLHAQLVTNLRSRHKEDPILRFRSRTLWNTTEPLWNEEWVLEHIPATGFDLKVRIYDEDTGDHDDRLGNVHIAVGRISEGWEGIRNQPYKIKKRMGSKRAYFLRAIAVCMRQASEMSGHLYVSVQVLGPSPGDDGSRAYTTGLNYWCKHYSPLLGRIAGSKTTREEDADDNVEDDQTAYEDDNQNDRTPIQQTSADTTKPAKAIPFAAVVSKQKKPKSSRRFSRYNFQANQIQLTGPVPPELHHRYVEFRPFIKALFTASGVRGIILQKALHHQHAQVYNYNRDTKYGVFREGPCTALTEKFLDLCHHAEGGRIFTYVITLDALMRFTETGKEFGIDLLSKHTMHADADIYIAYSGEFLIRQIVNPNRRSQGRKTREPAETNVDSRGVPKMSTVPDSAQSGNGASRPQARRNTSAGSPRDPSHYELVIDNESGTYRPNGAVLPHLHAFLSRNFPGLKIVTLDSLRDGELLKRLKLEQREHKRAEGGARIVYTQVSQSSSSSSLSSSDEEDLERRIEEQMLDERYREEEGLGSGLPRNEYTEKKEAGDAKHKIGEAVLPFVQNKNARNALTVQETSKG